MEIRIGHRVFAPSVGMTLLTAALCAVFVILGRWQWHRGALSQAEWTRFSQGAEKVIPIGPAPLGSVSLFQRVSIAGRYDGTHQFLLDNRSYEGHPGYEVLTPLVRSGGEIALVDRGWVSFTGRRDRLPGIAIAPGGEMSVVGRVANLPSAGLALGRAAPPLTGPWPRVTSFPTMQELSRSLGSTLAPRILLLDPHEANGYVRDWHPPGIEPARHWSYAIQWWAFAAVVLFLWVRLGFRPGKVAA